MPLTPEDVSNKEFTTVRLREGYEMSEVDNFLDEVEAELIRLLRENAELRDKLSASAAEGTSAPAPVVAEEDAASATAASATTPDEAPAAPRLP